MNRCSNVMKGVYYGCKTLDYDTISEYTNNLSKERLISKFQFGTLFRGWNGERELSLKVWNSSEALGDSEIMNPHDMMMDEVVLFLKLHVKGLPKLIGCCDDKGNHVLIYDLCVMNTLHNLIPTGEFSWRDRMKVALGIALTLKRFHAAKLPFIIRNISATHIMCEKDYTPWFYEFGLITGALNPERHKIDEQTGYPGYIDPYFIDTGRCSKKTDVYAYGVILLGLITGRVINDDDPDSLRKWAEEEFYGRRKLGIKRRTLVDPSFKSDEHFDPNDGCRVTRLAMQCIKCEPDERPEMDQVLRILRGLNVVKHHINESHLNEAFEAHVPKV